MNIKILGNGGAINNGLFYNSFIIDNHILFETPPDIMITLNNQNININNIDSIFISHFHGDHFFGFPFLVLNLFYNNFCKEFKKINIYGPKGLRDEINQLLIMAFSKDHPCYKWMNEYFIFNEISEKKAIISKYNVEYFEVEHMVITYGIILYKEDNIFLFSYIPDSIWTKNIEVILNNKPKIVIIDLNGNKNDKQKVHISFDDLLEKGLKITYEKTIYYGTHLKEEFISNNKYIKCCKSGDEINL